ncbi:Integrator complex subunit 6-A [Hypsibius exemplaris]|uniref:Integrator complex subunit 6-A n=1 Tax=Hypsibius exemplaris TaxID=2072580 RepID=A0A1W0WPV8_HYPEX|nr:Integrator complex subunit 6-A [Hypsibius exemplaris]
MTIILFIVDNSISMSQRSNAGTSFLDVAKKAVETFMKLRARDPAHRLDRIMLMTFDEPPTHLKVGWRESLMVFQNELKNMQPTAMSTGSQILSAAFELLNVNRLQSGIDTYGQGRNPFYLESSVIILLSDGHTFSTSQSELAITMSNKIAGLELTMEPYRWDQRLFSVVLRIPGVRSEEKLPTEELPRDSSVLEGFSYMTGGRSFVVESVKSIDAVMTKIADSMQNGVMIRLEPLEEAVFGGANIAVNRMLYLPRNPNKTHFTGHWPLPESFWPDMKSQSVLPPRNSHPVLKYRPSMEDVPQPPMIRDIPFPVDRYEIEHSALTEDLLEKSERFKHWEVFLDAEIPGREPIHQLCGYLSIQNRTESQPGGPDKVLTLNVLPIDYIRLFELFESFNRDQNSRSREWKAQFDAYISSIPPYMTSALRRFLVKTNLHSLIPESFDQCLSSELRNYVGRIKSQAKNIFENTIARPNEPFPVADAIPVIQRSTKPLERRNGSAAGEPPDISLKADFDAMLAKSVAERVDAEAAAFQIHLRTPLPMQQRAYITRHRNPFDVDREDLVCQLNNLKFSLLHPDRWKGSGEPDKHIPIGQMGNYQDYLKSAPKPLRDIGHWTLEDSQKPDRPMFGNPFQDPRKQKQRMASGGMGGMHVDEADVDNFSNTASAGGGGHRKRSLSESRGDLSGGPTSSLTGRVRSRSMSPAGLRSPVKRRPPSDGGGVNNINGAAANGSASTDTTSSTVRRLNMGSTGGGDAGTLEISALEPVGAYADLIMDEPAVILLSNGLEGKTNGVRRPRQADEEESEEAEDLFLDEGESDADVVRDFRQRALKTIKTPGRNFKPILDMINSINGNVSLKQTVIHHVIQEAGRFRRDSLITLLKETYAV